MSLLVYLVGEINFLKGAMHLLLTPTHLEFHQ